MSAVESETVFFYYASRGVEAAKKMCGALRAVGVEGWFD